MDLVTLTAMFPVVKELISKGTPRIRKWMEKKAKREDPSLLLQLQTIEEIRGLREETSGLRDYMLVTSIMSAMLTNPDLSEDEIRGGLLKGARIAKSIVEEIKTIESKSHIE